MALGILATGLFYPRSLAMKKLILASLALLSLNSFSQSYFVLENGITLTTDKNGFVYDFNHYTPVNRVTIKGGQYLVEDANVIVTVDDKGALYRKYEILPKQVIGKGMNYFIGDNGYIYTIDHLGYVHIVEDDAKMLNVTKFGGNFFIVNSDELFTVNLEGSYEKVQVEGLRPADILSFGGNYFMTNRGVLYTVAANGKVKRANERVGIIVKKGGNYFVDTAGAFYTVAEDGTLKLPGMPISLRIQAMSKLGANYFVDSTGKLFTVDKDGNIFERWTSHDLKTTKIISL
jgi:hypothetical protein